MPRWLDRSLDWINIDAGPKLFGFQPRRLDYVGLAVGLVAVVLDGAFFNGWRWALMIDPFMIIFGWMAVLWFVKGD